LTSATPFLVRRGPGLDWNDRAEHEAAWEQDSELYALTALDENVHVNQQARILFQTLRRSRVALSGEACRTLERIVGVLVVRLPVETVLAVFLALRRDRANHKHVSRTILAYLLENPQLELLVHKRRATLVALLEHALGKNTARGIVRELAAEQPDPVKVRPLLRWTSNPERARAVVRSLYRQGTLPLAVRQPSQRRIAERKRGPATPKTVTATNRGDIAATLVHIYRGGQSPELGQALERYVEQATQGLPRFGGRLALVLDASVSTRGYGEREFCCIAQSQALRLVLQRCCSDVRVHVVGGTGEPPMPGGATDLASALLDALAEEPDLVAIITDGYENVLHGDLAQVAAALPAAGCDVGVVFCQSKFTSKDDLTQRRPACNLPELEFWHENDFALLLRQLFVRARGLRGREFLRGHLMSRLEQMEKENVSWITFRSSPRVSI